LLKTRAFLHHSKVIFILSTRHAISCAVNQSHRIGFWSQSYDF
jgi:hypothetical protein